MYCAAYNKKRGLFTPVTDVPIDVIGAGYMSVETKAPSYRPNGTPSYQLIYIKSCKNSITYTIGNQEYPAQKDDIIIYRPHETQKYNYTVKDEALVYWIHFDGTEVENLMKKFYINDIRVMRLTDTTISIPKTIKKIMNEINASHHFSHEIISAELYGLLAKLAQFNYLNNNNFSKIDEIIDEIKINFSDNTSNQDYAYKCGLSLPHFLRCFKQVTGTSPLNYKLNLRINHAKQLITSTELSINQISQVVGFNDPFHFSRYFKKLTGHSPKEYREKFSKSIDNQLKI